MEWTGLIKNSEINFDQYEPVSFHIAPEFGFAESIQSGPFGVHGSPNQLGNHDSQNPSRRIPLALSSASPMAAAGLRHLLLKKTTPPPPLRLLASFDNHLFHDPSPFRIPPQALSIPDAPAGEAPPPSVCAPLHAYPSFPHCFLSGPIYGPLPCGSAAELDDALVRDPAPMWADSVKKKRKKKMNKHKLRKRRKLLRRKT